jgi:cell fate (sporulation/competence/biofilm development) regulator YlbF (YheA/YmcA/DUF963 family)
MDTILKFKEAALVLQRDERCLNLEKARRENDENQALQDKIGEFNLARLELNRETQREGENGEKLARLNNRIDRLYADIMQSPGVLAYNEAKRNMKLLVEHINAIVAAAVDGDDPMRVEAPAPDGCGGDCAGCAGCGVE